MKRIVYSTLLLGGVFSLFAFSPVNKANVDYTEVDSNSEIFATVQVGSFEQSEHMKTTSDKGVWYRWYKIWTVASPNGDMETMESIITKN